MIEINIDEPNAKATLVKSLLKLSSVPKPDDTADALALAICHGHSAGSLYGKLAKG